MSVNSVNNVAYNTDEELCVWKQEFYQASGSYCRFEMPNVNMELMKEIEERNGSKRITTTGLHTVRFLPLT